MGFVKASREAEEYDCVGQLNKSLIALKREAGHWEVECP